MNCIHVYKQKNNFIHARNLFLHIQKNAKFASTQSPIYFKLNPYTVNINKEVKKHTE